MADISKDGNTGIEKVLIPAVCKYEDDTCQIDIQVDGELETFWMTQPQLAQLFGTARSTIVEHINNIYRERELDPPATCRKFRQVQNEGGRSVSRDIDHYNLDMVLSVGLPRQFQ